ncbi:AraC family transcriptional regulator [Puteibacter caeruleilacunae]|nr:AraC family transcriptional regulator [Puteibacter caeruleilacunae]
MGAKKFQLKTFIDNENEVFHVARTTINSKDDLQIHDHDYAEIFWIKAGNGIHLINDQEVQLHKGSLCMIRPHDKHTFKLDQSQESLVVTNIAFYEESLNTYRERYFSNDNAYFWSKDDLPFLIQLSSDQLNELSTITDQLISQPRDYIHLDYLMINIFRMVISAREQQTHIPHWLAYALNNYNTPKQFQAGSSGFVALTERTVDHVNRTLQKHLKQTLTETVIKARLQYASQQLIMTNSSIKSICYDCGFESISYFYRLFRKYTGYTPMEFRKKNHKVF